MPPILLFKIPGGHKYYDHDGKILVADDDGLDLHRPVTLDRSQPIKFGQSAIVSVVDAHNEPGHVVESAEGGLMLAARLGLLVDAGGSTYSLTLSEPPAPKGRKTTWKQGERVKYYGQDRYCDVFAGLYWYSGLGSGTYFSKTGDRVENLSPQEANAIARDEGIEMTFIDSFGGYRHTFVGN